MNELSANIFNIQYFSTEDGPGLRTTVFMKGCPLRCLWCQNPEGLTAQVQLVHDRLRCIGCGACLESCPQGALENSGGEIFFGENCTHCLTCAGVCPAQAIRVIGSRLTLEELTKKLLRDKPFYEKSGGGITFSGGECLLQHTFLAAALPALKQKGVHVCLDTAGCAEPAIFRDIARLADLVLFDLKIIDDRRHRAFTGASNSHILENAAWLGQSGIPTWIRIPVIPGYTDSEDNIAAIAGFIKEEMGAVERIDLLGFNDLCVNDYAKLKMTFPLAGTARVKESAILRLREIAARSGAGKVTVANYQEGV